MTVANLTRTLKGMGFEKEKYMEYSVALREDTECEEWFKDGKLALKLVKTAGITRVDHIFIYFEKEMKELGLKVGKFLK